MIAVTINSIAVKVLIDSFSIDDFIEERSVCRFVVKSLVTDNIHYKEGQYIEVDENGTLIYAGYIDTSFEKKVNKSVYHTISCKDMHYLSDKRIIAKAYENVTAGSIVADLITEKLGAEGVTVGTIQDGPTVTEAIFNYVTVSKAIESLAEKANFIWYIDYDKKLYFIARSTNVAPWTATGSDMQADSVSVENGNSKYRNTQYVKGGRDITDVLTENKVGDGNTRTWVVGFPIAKEPALTLNSVAIPVSDVGIRGVESEKKYYWSKGDNTISQDEAETLLTSSDTLKIEYQGEFDIVVKTLNESEIEAKKTVEGTSGIVEDIASENNSTTREAAFEVGNSKLEKYGVVGRSLKFTTQRTGLWAGQILTVTLPEHDMNSTEMLIESVAIQISDTTWYDVICTEGPEKQSWTKMFEYMATRGETFVVRDNISEDEVLITLQTFTKTWESSDSPNIFTEVYASETLFPATTLYPMFKTTERVRYIELLDASDNVLYRAAITKQTGTNVLQSIVFVAPYAGIGSIAKVRWYGGTLAASTNGSGSVVDEQAWTKVKTALEALQIDKTDTRNFIPDSGTIALTPEYIQGIDDDIADLEDRSA